MKIDRRFREPECSVEAIREDITPNREPRKCIWQEDGKKIFVTCPGCSAINDISDYLIRPTGKTGTCVTCRNCGTHFWLTLKRWDGRNSFACRVCERVERTKKKLPKKWVVGRGRSSKYPYECLMCPTCWEKT